MSILHFLILLDSTYELVIEKTYDYHVIMVMRYENLCTEITRKNDFQLEFSTQKDTIKKLDLVYFALTEIPAWVYDFKNLQELNLSGSMISKLPRKLNRLKN